MKYDDFLSEVIRQGTEAAKKDYAHNAMKRDGAVAGFAACKNLQPPELKALLARATDQRNAAHFDKNQERYWYYRCFEAEVEWVCNVVSAMLQNQGLPVIVVPTVRGMIQSARIVGVAGMTDAELKSFQGDH